MESTGNSCKLCELPLESNAEAIACGHCQTVFHLTCFESALFVCPACGQQCEPPTPPEAQTNPQSWEFAEGQFQRLKPSLLYRFSLVIVSCAMILLPLIYVGLIVFFGYGIYYYATHFTSILDAVHYGRGGALVAFIGYFGPIFIGILLGLFFVKPFFAPRPEQDQTFSLNHADAPQLFALIGWICRSLDAPIPSRVDVDCTVNAGAGFRGGFRSLFGNDIRLVIGLPLAAGLNVSQFAGIMAHEYGHFSQGTAMRADYIIRNINGWFYRIVFERDAWDLFLIEASEEGESGFVILIFLFARMGVAIGRGVLWLLMAAGALLSSFLSRQMEFNADQYEMKLSGSETFVSTVRRLQQLNLGFLDARKQLGTKWKKEKKLYDRIPEFIVSRANEISAEAQDRHYAAAFKQKTRLFDSHPSDAERMQRAREANEPGALHDTAPATSLFTDFPELSRRLTVFFYRDLIGPKFSPDWIIPAEQTKALTDHDYATDRATLNAYFLGLASDWRPIILQENRSLHVRSHQSLGAELQNTRRQMEELRPAAESALAEFLAWETRVIQAGQAAQLLQAGFQFDPADFGLPDSDMDRALAEARECARAANVQLQPFENLGKARLHNTIQLLCQPQYAALVPNAKKLHEQAKDILWVLTRLGFALELLPDLREECAKLEAVLHYRRAQPSADNLTASLENLSTSIQDRVNAVQQRISQIRYPFHHATEQVMVSEYARNKEYHADPHELILREGQSHLEKLLDLHVRLLANLITICNEVESRLAAEPGSQSFHSGTETSR